MIWSHVRNGALAAVVLTVTSAGRGRRRAVQLHF